MLSISFTVSFNNTVNNSTLLLSLFNLVYTSICSGVMWFCIEQDKHNINTTTKLRNKINLVFIMIDH